MGKYTSHEDMAANAPINFRQDTISEDYLAGLEGIAPLGMKPKSIRGQRFEDNCDLKASAKWHHNYDKAMFGGSEIGGPHEAQEQKGLEKRPDDVKRAPRR